MILTAYSYSVSVITIQGLQKTELLESMLFNLRTACMEVMYPAFFLQLQPLLHSLNFLMENQCHLDHLFNT